MPFLARLQPVDQAELAALRLAPAPQATELALADLVLILESCRGSRLTNHEHKAAASFWRKMRPILTDAARDATNAALRRQVARRRWVEGCRSE